MTRTYQVIRPLNLSKEVVEPQLAEMRARMELATEPAAFALGMLTALLRALAGRYKDQLAGRSASRADATALHFLGLRSQP